MAQDMNHSFLPVPQFMTICMPLSGYWLRGMMVFDRPWAGV